MQPHGRWWATIVMLLADVGNGAQKTRCKSRHVRRWSERLTRLALLFASSGFLRLFISLRTLLQIVNSRQRPEGSIQPCSVPSFLARGPIHLDLAYWTKSGTKYSSTAPKECYHSPKGSALQAVTIRFLSPTKIRTRHLHIRI